MICSRFIVVTFTCLATAGLALAQAPLGTAFIYQGRLTDLGQPANGTFNMSFALYDALTGGNMVGSVQVATVPVSNGLFSLPLDFGAAAFDGNARWLQIAVSGTPLTPRQELTPAPHASYAAQAGSFALPFSASWPGSTAAISLQASGNGPCLELESDEGGGVFAYLGASNTNPAFYATHAGTAPAVQLETTQASALLAVTYSSATTLFSANGGGGPSAIFLGGPVGIGTQTPSSGAGLTVGDTIQINSGGVRFPDGTVQDSAAQRLWHTNATGIHADATAVGVGTSSPDATLHLNSPLEKTSIHLQTTRLTGGTLLEDTEGAVAASTSGNDQDWTNPSGALVSDDVYANTTLIESPAPGWDATAFSRDLHVTDFGFAIPANHDIAWITLVVEGHVQKSCTGCDNIYTTLEAGVIGSFCHSLVPYNHSSDEQRTIVMCGSTNETPTTVNSPTFGVRFSAYMSALAGGSICTCDASCSVLIDSVAVGVTHYDPQGGTLAVDWSLGVLETDSVLRITPDATMSSTEGLFIKPDGKVGIGVTPSPTLKLSVNGDAGKPGAGMWSGLSDARLKRNLTPLTGTLDKLLKLHGYEFEYSEEAVTHELYLPGRQMGLIAQEVEQVFPDWVTHAPDGYKLVTERATTALMVEALRDLRTEKDEQIARQQQQLGALQAENLELRERLARIEQALFETSDARASK